MTTRRRWARGLTAAALVFVLFGPVAVSPAFAEDPPKKKGFFNRLRGGGEKPAEETAAAETPAPETATKPPAAAEPAAPAPADAVPPPSKAARPTAYNTKDLEGPIGKIRRSTLGADPAVTTYLDRIERGEASAAQLNDFAGFLLRRGVPNVAAPFQKAATELAPDQPALWVNLGTIEQARGKSGAASSAYKKAIDLDPTNGMAYYGLGVVADSGGNYDDAIEYYRRALLIEPNLADPKVNPQVVNNERMLAVQLLLARDKAGALSLPLLPAKSGEPSGAKGSAAELPPSDR